MSQFALKTLKNFLLLRPISVCEFVVVCANHACVCVHRVGHSVTSEVIFASMCIRTWRDPTSCQASTLCVRDESECASLTQTDRFGRQGVQTSAMETDKGRERQ